MSLIAKQLFKPLLSRSRPMVQCMKCHNVFGMKDLIHQEKPDYFFSVKQVTSDDHEMVVDMVKRHYFPEHVLVKARGMDLTNDRAIDEYLLNVLKQGNSLYAATESGNLAGICISYAYSQDDLDNLKKFAYYRQDPNTKDFLNFTAKLLETPNLWNVFNQPDIFEIKMLAVLPEYRRQGLGVWLAEKSREKAHDQGYKVIRMDCVNPYDYKIAERCSLQCLIKFPLHKLFEAQANRNSDDNRIVRVYVDFRPHVDAEHDRFTVREKQADLEKLFD